MTAGEHGPKNGLWLTRTRLTAGASLSPRWNNLLNSAMGYWKEPHGRVLDIPLSLKFPYQPDYFFTRIYASGYTYVRISLCIYVIWLTQPSANNNLPVIQDVTTSCGCTKGSYNKEPVRPGTSLEQTVTYDAEEKGGHFNKMKPCIEIQRHPRFG